MKIETAGDIHPILGPNRCKPSPYESDKFMKKQESKIHI